MYCKNCNKEVDRTLELYNGAFACALCKNKIQVGALKIDSVGDEQFVLSEIMFHNSLQITDNKAKRRQSLNKAMDLCKKAAFHGHPKAVVRLAYYYEMGYVKVDAAQAFKMACSYYRAVWSNPFEEASLRSYEDLRKIAATRHLALLEHTPPQLKLDVEHYGYDKVAKEMLSVRAIDVMPRHESGAAAEDVDDSMRVSGILNTCLSKTRAPLFGLIALSGAALRNWANGETTLGRKTVKRFEPFIKEGVEMYLLWGDQSHYRHVVGQHSFVKEDNTGNTLADDETYYLCFLNGNVKKYGAVKKLLEPNGSNTELLFRLVNRAALDGYADMVFYADDVEFFRSKGESVKHATTDLIAAVCDRKL